MALTRRVVALLSLLALPHVVTGAEMTFHVAADDETTEVVFRSKATLETFEGRTHDLSGYVTLDPADLTTLHGEVVCDLTSLDTGIGLRNKHMHANVLHTDEHPTATFVLEGAGEGSLVMGLPVTFEVNGQMSLHGVTRPLVADVEATLVSDQLVAFEATFEVALADFEIPRPKMLVMRVAETVDLTVKAQATAGTPPKRTR